MSEWRPIATVPKDGEDTLLLYIPNIGNWPDSPAIITAVWDEGQGWVDNGMARCSTWGNPTHWMPLPRPPQDDSTAA